LSPDGRFAYISGLEYVICDLTDDITLKIPSIITSFATFTKNSKFLLYSEENNIINFIDLEKYEVDASLDYGRYSIMKELKLSEDGEYLVVLLYDRVDIYSLKNLYN
jgi:hypothetical protein